MDQQIFWNDLMNPAEDRLPEFSLPPSHTNIVHLDSDGRHMDRWSLGEPSSRNSQNEIQIDESRKQHGRSSSLVSSAGTDPNFEGQYEPTNFLSADNVNLNFHTDEIVSGPLLLQSPPHFDATTQNIDVNARPLSNGVDDCQIIENPNTYKFGVSLNDLPSSDTSNSDFLGSQSRNSRHLVEEIDGSSDCSLRGRRLPSKRKVFEGANFQSSADRNSTFQHGECSSWRPVSAQNITGSRFNTSTPLENVLGIESSDQVVTGPGMVAGGAPSESLSSIPDSAEGFQRNPRMRISPSHMRDSVPTNLLSSVGDNDLNISSPGPLLRFLPVHQSPELGSAHTGHSTSSQNQSFVVPIPPLRRNEHSFRRNGASSSSLVNHSRSHISGARDVMLHREPNSRNLPRNTTRYPAAIPTTELRNSAQNSTNQSLTDGNINILGNAVSRTGVRPPVISSSASNRVPHRSLSNSRRLSQAALYRSLLDSSIGSEPSGQSGNHPPLLSGPTSSLEMVPPPVVGGSYHGLLGFPHSLHNVSTVSEGRRRMLSEIRNALDLVRRGEGSPIEDYVMLFSHPTFVAGADAHDRHRDMRLDVDNMSYEELLALEERIGNVNTGLSEETILKYLKRRKYSCMSVTLELMPEMEPCCICQEDYSEGDDLGTIDCGHGFHAGCIKQWLAHKNLCPICKMTALKEH